MNIKIHLIEIDVPSFGAEGKKNIGFFYCQLFTNL